MTQRSATPNGRLLLVGDLRRLGPILVDVFAPRRIDGVPTYLHAIGELRRSPTCAVLVSHDQTCRRLDSAMSAIKRAAGDARVVLACQPAYESMARKLTAHGVDDYVINPPDSAELERALGIPSTNTTRQWIETPTVAPTPAVEELARLADVLERAGRGDPRVLDAMAALLGKAIGAQWVMIVVDAQIGKAGAPPRIDADASLIESMTIGARRCGQLRIGPSTAGGYTHEDTAKLRHYSVLFARTLESAGRMHQWRHMAMTDDLTGLPNRRRLFEFLEDKIARAGQTGSRITALVFDIDDFKRYNDQYGHDAGDEILRETGQLFVQCSRKTDLVARYGGDEFVVVFWDPQGPRTAGSHQPDAVNTVINRFSQALKKHRFTRLGPEALGCLTISGGLARFPSQANSAMELIEAADRALLRAKKAGKNRFHVIGEAD
jgi:diguanylate cyclase (GGDEF)-like protein